MHRFFMSLYKLRSAQQNFKLTDSFYPFLHFTYNLLVSHMCHLLKSLMETTIIEFYESIYAEQ